MRHKMETQRSGLSYSPVDKVASRLAFLRHTSVGTARQHMYRVREEYHQVIQAHLDMGAAGRMAAYHEPVERIVEAALLAQFDDSAIHEAQQADLAEDMAEAAYHRSGCMDTLKTWFRKKVVARIAEARLMAGMAQKIEEGRSPVGEER